MNRSHTVTLLAALALGAPACPADTLVLQSPLPFGSGVHEVFPLSPTRWVALGSDPYAARNPGSVRSIRLSDDAGRTWRDVLTHPDPHALGSLVFTDTLHGYACGGGEDAYRSLDGGLTWSPMTYQPFPSINEWSILGPTEFFTGGGAVLRYSPDGGSTWQTRSSLPAVPALWSLAFRDQAVGVVAGQRINSPFDAGFYRTTDGGAHWTLVRGGSAVGGTGVYPAGPVAWTGPQTLIASDGIDIIRSTDAGATWSVLAPGAVPGGLAEMERVPGTSILCATSSGGDVWRSTDAGETWSRALEGIGSLPDRWAIHFVDPSFGWVTGPEGEVYLSTDAGATWTLASQGVMNEVRAIAFFDDHAGLAATASGFVFRTIDAGATWAVRKLRITGQQFQRNESLNSLSVVPPAFAAAAGDGGTVFKTLDGGATWQPVPVSVNQTLLNDLFISDVYFSDPLTGWVVGSNLNQFQGSLNVWRTRDGGASWQPAGEFGGLISSIQFVGNSGWMGLNQAAQIRRTTDGGEHWSLVDLPDSFVSNAKVRFADATTGFVAGFFGYLAKSTSGGAGWTRIPMPAEEDYTDLQVLSPAEAYLVGADDAGSFYRHTTDGGATWPRVNVATVSPVSPIGTVSVVHARPSGHAWLAGYAGTIQHLAPSVPCAGDYNRDGVASLQDLFDYLRDYFTAAPGADVNASGSVTVQDLFDFLVAWFAGC